MTRSKLNRTTLLAFISLFIFTGCSAAPSKEGRVVLADTVVRQHKSNAVAAFLAGGALFPWTINSLNKTPNAFFIADSIVFKVMTSMWRDSKAEKGGEDAFLDDLVRVQDAGYLREYMVSFFKNPNWTLPLDQGLRLAEFRDWARRNIQVTNPPFFVFVLDSEDKPMNATPRRILLGPDFKRINELTETIPKGAECGEHLAFLESVVAKWPPEHPEGSRVVSAPMEHFLDYITENATTGERRPFPTLLSPEYFWAAFLLERCATRDGGDRDRWLSVLYEMNPTNIYGKTAEWVSEAVANLPAICPGSDDDVDEERCRTERPPEYGLTPESPLEIGIAAGGQSLWYGRLICPNGALPAIRRMGNAGPPTVPSESPTSPLGGRGTELLDVWEVQCPGIGDPVTLYSNLYRCGLNCPPGAFRVLDARVHRIYQEASALIRKNAFDKALRKMEEIAPDERTTLDINHRFGVLYLQKELFAKARKALETALAMNPTNPYLKLHISFVDLQEGKRDEYATVVEALLDELPDDHSLHAELVCRKGVVLRDQNKDEGTTLMRKGCDLGHKPCCEMLDK